MSDKHIRPKFKCNECGDLHDDDQDAYDCCPPGFDGRPPSPTAEELEAAGQMRLVE